MLFYLYKKFNSFGLLFIIITFFPLSNGWGSHDQNVFEIIESNDDRIVIEMKPFELKFIERTQNGERYEIPQIDNYQWLQTPGKPQLPSAGVLIGIPINSTPRIQILDYQTSLLESKNIYPVPQLIVTGDKNESYLTEQFYLDQQSYSQNSYYPAELVQITSINTLRQQRIARLEFHPVQYNPVTKQLQKIVRLKFAVLFNQAANQTEQSMQPATKATSEPYEKIYKHLLANYPSAIKWREPKSIPDQPSSLAIKPTSWYNANNIFYKLFIEESGIYRLDRAYLDSIGIDVTTIDPRTLKIYNKGAELPVFVAGETDGSFDQDDYIQFYGERNQGDSTYFDPYTDTNIYWLTWSGDFGQRMISKFSATEADTEIHDYIEQLHLEQDNVYHEGDNSVALINTELVSGEGWVWRFFYPGDREIISIPTWNFSENNIPCRLKIKLRGTTIDLIRPNHHVRVLFNDNQVGDFYFNGTEDYLFDANIPSVQAGENKLEILSVGDTGAQIDQFYLDWIELEYPRQLVANGDEIKFRLSNGANQLVKASIWGFTDPDIQLFDLTNQAIIHNPSIVPGKQLICQVVSAGFDDGFFVQFQINAEDIISQWHRGHNLVEIDEVSGQVLATKHYDTNFSTAESDSLAQYIQQLPTGRIVMVGIMDEGSQSLTSAAYQALESLGSQLIRSVGFRDSWAMIGKKGAAIGIVPEAITTRGSGVATVKDTVAVTGSGRDFYLTFADTLKRFQEFIAVSKKAVKKPIRSQLDISADLATSQIGADLIIISHQNFLTSAQRLADYRIGKNGLRVKVVDVEDIYDEFNFGLINPQAIKDFLKYTFDHWQSPSPSYVILFGDASWDFKKNLGQDVNENFVPSYGNPVSDNWFVCFDGPDDVLPDMFVGRIPVANLNQAEIIVDKIIAYENTPSASWKKNVLFITGGFNSSEQRTFMNQSAFLINNYVTPPPASCRVFQINKTTEGYFEGEKKQEILDAMNHGMMWVNFLGHAGSRTWDLMFNHPDIDELNNNDKYPFITSMTCHTGRFAEPEGSSFSEHFLTTENKGAVGFWGTSGWGYVFQDNILLRNLFLATFVDTIHSLGKATTLAKIKLWESYGGGIYNVSTIHQYTLIGDPVTDLTLPEKADLTIGPSDVTFAPSAPAEADSFVSIKIRIQNWGLATKDSVTIAGYDIQGNEFVPIVPSLSKSPVGLEDSVIVPWNLKDQAGEHILRFVLDEENKIDEINEENNSNNFQIYVYSSKLTISRPFEFQVVSPRQVALQVNNPAFASSGEIQRFYQFEVDTSNLFNSPLRISSPQISQGKLVTNWQTPELADTTTYFWRCRTLDGLEFGDWITTSLFTRSDSTPYIWQQQHPQQFVRNDFNNIQISSHGLEIQQRLFVLEVLSAGYEDGNFARILVNSQPVIEPSRGHNLAVISPTNGQVLFVRTYDILTSQDEANAMADLIHDLVPGSYVLISIMDEGSYNMTERAYQALESIGSKLCRSVGYRDSWAIVGIKGAPIGSVAEKHVPAAQGIATVQDTLKNYFPLGTVNSAPIGPADSWYYVSWGEDISAAGTNISLDVIGFNKKLSQWDTLIVGLSNFNGEDLSSIDAQIYPLLKLRGNLSDDEGLHTPVLPNWSVSYEPVADPAIGPEVVTFSVDTLMEGDLLNIDLNVYNVGMKIVDSVAIRFSLNLPDSGKIKLGEDKILTRILVDNFQTISQTWESSGRTGNIQFFIEIDPDNKLNELSESNNYYSKAIYIVADSTKPQVEVTYDGKQIVVGDYVSNNPVILSNIYDNNMFLIENDTTRINLFLDNTRVSYSGNKNILSVTPIKNNDEPRLKARVRFTPELSDGDHSLEIFIKDARNNLTYHRDDFQVISDFKILNVLNYPNPFREGTEFTFNLTQPSEKVTIKIFTVAGRLVRMLENHYLAAGFHHVYWDGLDQDLNEMANGVYLYKIIARSGEKQVEQIEKLVIMR